MRSSSLSSIIIFFIVVCSAFCAGWESNYDTASRSVELCCIETTDKITAYTDDGSFIPRYGALGYYFGNSTNTNSVVQTRVGYTELSLNTNVIGFYTNTVSTNITGHVVLIVDSTSVGTKRDFTLSGIDLFDYDVHEAIRERMAVLGGEFTPYLSIGHDNLANAKSAKSYIVEICDSSYYIQSPNRLDKSSFYIISDILDIPSNYDSITYHKTFYSGPSYKRIMTNGLFIYNPYPSIGNDETITNKLWLFNSGYINVFGTNGEYVSIIETNNNIVTNKYGSWYETKNYSIKSITNILNHCTIFAWNYGTGSVAKITGYVTGSQYVDDQYEYSWSHMMGAYPGGCVSENVSYGGITSIVTIATNVNYEGINGGYIKFLRQYSSANQDDYITTWAESLKPTSTAWIHNGVGTDNDIRDYKSASYSYVSDATAQLTQIPYAISNLNISSARLYIAIKFKTNAVYNASTRTIKETSYTIRTSRCYGKTDDSEVETYEGTTISIIGWESATNYSQYSFDTLGIPNVTTNMFYIENSTETIYYDYYAKGGYTSLVAKVDSDLENFPIYIQYTPSSYESFSYVDGSYKDQYISASWSVSSSCTFTDDCGTASIGYGTDVENFSCCGVGKSINIDASVSILLDFAVTNGFKYY